MSVNVEIFGYNEWLRDLGAMRRRAANMAPIWPKVGRKVRDAFRQQFAGEGARFGDKWSPLRPNYALWKRRRGYKGGILVRQGDMRKGFISSPMDIERYSGSKAEFGSSSKIAQYHQDGTRRGLPPRPIVTDQMVAYLSDQLVEAAAERLVSARDR